ncbi:MAG: outer membrane protein assembly factor BamD [Rhizobiaceae bacterium]
MVFITGAAPIGRMRSVLLAMSLLAVPAALVTGCQSDKDELALANYVAPTDPADQLYNEGLANLNAGRLKEASAKFDAIDKEHPYSEYSRKAEVMAAFTKYRMGEYDDAISKAQRYMELYPSTEDAAYVQYIIGLSYFRQIREVTQDQKESRQTIEAMDAVIQNYPDSPYVEDAKTKIRFARDQLAGKEMQVGRYYLERREYLAAIKRFRAVVENYSNSNQVEEALARLTEAYYAMGIASEAQTAAAVLGRNYPHSKWYKDSYALLQSGGLTPAENRGSWISKALSVVTGG